MTTLSGAPAEHPGGGRRSSGVAHLPSRGRPGSWPCWPTRPIRVVTLTVTEKAYHLDPATGRLLDDEVRADLETDRDPGRFPAC